MRRPEFYMAFRNTKRSDVFFRGAICLATAAIAGALSRTAVLGAQGAAPQASAARPVGTIKSISGNNTIVLTTDAGNDVTILVQEGAKVLRVEPGQKDLKEAAPMQLQELLAGDRILVRGQLAADGKTVLATSVIAMKKADIAERQAREREDWVRRGVAGLVGSVDAAANSILITLPGIGEKKTVTIRLSKDTVLRRYAADSVKFDDARPALLSEIKAGDQLRARGVRTADGTELTAAEVVSGTFPNIAGTISSIDAAANSITVHDLATKKSITVKITLDSEMRKLPLPLAQRIAVRLKGTAAEAPAAIAGSASAGGSQANANSTQGTRPAGPAAGAGPGEPGVAARNGGGGTGDLQQALSRMPAARLADLQKGDAVMIVATEGGPDGVPFVITLLSGVEPILQASPSSNASTILSPWSLSGAPSAEAGNP
jgi:hypothetical protein